MNFDGNVDSTKDKITIFIIIEYLWMLFMSKNYIKTYQLYEKRIKTFSKLKSKCIIYEENDHKINHLVNNKKEKLKII